MSKCQQTLRHFLNNLPASPFPRESVLTFLPTVSLTYKEFLNIYSQLREDYMSNVEHYRQIAILLFLSLSKNIEGTIESAIQFIEGMILSRLMLLIFNHKGQFQIDTVLFYLQPTLQLTVLKALQNSKDKMLLNLLVRINSKQRKFSNIGFLMQMLFIRKIQKYLDEASLNEFNEVLKDLLPPKKWVRLSFAENALHFRHIAILRQQEDRQENFYLQFLNEKRLVKMKQPSSPLPNWVQEAFWRIPKQLNLSEFKSSSVSQVFCLLCQVQIFASSPLIQQFDCYTNEEKFLTLFQQFLMGFNISRESYEFQWQTMKRSLQLIRRNMHSQAACYLGGIAEEIVRTAQNKQCQR